ncbi:MAG: aryl-sulfate sulfotransferase [Bacteroidetes bacterium]|nr:aryl-sulfate sulfotransferase [Bacteroidota bacterium]MDA0902861.1 aryl-sulfate sulfotransferase [Bacteroidota bacterium]MDA1241986.1 aryl-sulfate sulfotransferase [Bacteroidota bacterium]
MLRFHSLLLIACLATFPSVSLGQTQTVGVFLNSESSYNGYTLLDPMGSTTTYLIDNCGQVVNTWTSEFNPGGSCYLLDDGSLIRGCRVSGSFFGGGVGGRLERRSWNDELIWSLDWADNSIHHHHDFAWMPNGNVLVLAWEAKSEEEAALAGRLSPQTMWPEVVTEIAPTLPSGGEVVWEWHAWDHLVQDADPALPNHGNPADFPGRLDVNHANVGGPGGPGSSNSGDWTHANAINYNVALDQIALSSRSFNEIWVIDHSTSSAQSAGPAGDLIYRQGNPTTYGRGTEDDQIFFGQHDVQWIPEGHPMAGQFMIFNNGNRPECLCSSIDVWAPPMQDDGSYTLEDGLPFGPESLSWTYPAELDVSFFSPNISGVQPLPNGNMLVCEGASGHLFEVSIEGDVVWDYVNPEGNFGIVPQGTEPVQNAVFRAYRYGPDHPGIVNQDLTPGPLLEGGTLTDCLIYASQDTSSTEAVNRPLTASLSGVALHPNPASNLLHVHCLGATSWSIRSMQGQPVMSGELNFDSSARIDIRTLHPGLWLFTLFGNSSSTTVRFVKTL